MQNNHSFYHQNSSGLFDLSFSRENVELISFSEFLSRLSFHDRIDAMMNNNMYLKEVDYFEKEAMKIVSESQKKEGKKGSLSIEMKKNIHKCAIHSFFNDFFPKESRTVLRKLDDQNAVFSNDEANLMYILVRLPEKEPDFFSFWFGKEAHFFKLLDKNLTSCADLLGKSLYENPRDILKYGVDLMEANVSDELKVTADAWVTKWFNKKQAALLYNESNFKEKLIEYLRRTPTKANKLLGELVDSLHKMPEDLQEKIWLTLFEKSQREPQIIKNTCEYIQQFLKQNNSEKSHDTFYRTFQANLTKEERAKILGLLPQKMLKKYWDLLYPKNQDIVSDTINTENGTDFLGWHLLQQGVLKPEQMVQILSKTNLEKFGEFFLARKKILNPDVFKSMANKLSASTYYFWKWVRSFKETYDFERNLAHMYPELSEKIRSNKIYSKALDKNFNLIYQLACLGDTASLSNLKKQFPSEVFWQSLMQEKENHVSGFSALCHLGKRGLLKLISDLPLEKQKELFLQKNSQGKSALDECSGNFLRMVQENIFDKKYVKEEKQEPLPEKQEEKPQVVVSEELSDKARYPRTIIKIPAFKSDLEDYKLTNPELYEEVQEAMNDLSTMSKKRMQMELRNSWKNHRKLRKTPCAAKDIRGNNYRLGYVVSGDTDKNQGKIAFLFFWTHEEYNTKLWNSTEFLVKQANQMMGNAFTPSIPALPNPGNSGR